ncbi:MAG: helix-turn-helix domain-containing protein [Oxalobacteraceae bacterium]|jgi:cytoskeletal protein RodZ|nr:helix-turn-helix domain-containing protein [Oxalobacteraceae bacterium]
MKNEIDFDAITVDGARLRAAREARGLSVLEMAAAVTLSREQIQHMEDGGNRPFYTPAHKLLAVRKYSTALDIPYDEIVTGPGANQTIPVPDDAPPSMMAYSDMSEPVDLRLAAVERNAELRRLIATAAIVICILLAIYAKIRGSQDEATLNEPSADAMANQSDSQPAPRSPAPSVFKATSAVAAPTKPSPETKPGSSTALSSNEAEDSKTEPAAAKTSIAANNAGECQSTGDGEVKNWSPMYQRKADSRLYVISPKGGSVCFADASGKARIVELKPMVGQALGGKPPYMVRSAQLAQIEMYLQGFRVKIPAQTDSMKLIPTSQPAPAESSESGDPKEN